MAFKQKEQISFFLTSKCNLKCYYCYIPKTKINNKADQVISLDFASAGLKDFFNQSSSRTIRFFSAGEPTMAFTRMKEIRNVAYELAGDDLKVELETNGFFNRTIADWIEDNVDYLWISCDGKPEIQDAQRPALSNKGSSKVVHGNIRRFIQNKKIQQVGVRATIAQENINKQVELIEFFNTLGVKFVAASPVYRSKPNSKIPGASLLDFAKGFVPAYYRAIELGMFYQTLMIVNFDEEVDIYCQTSIPTPRLTTDDYVSSCDWTPFGPKYLASPVQEELLYGYYDRENDTIIYDEEKIKRFRQRNVDYLGKHACKGCRALKHCAGGCVGKMMAETDDLYKPIRHWCEAVLYLFDALPKNQPYPFIHP